MMDRKNKIEQEVEKTIQAFENAERLPKNPFFYTRLRARIDGQERRKRAFPESILKGWLRPVFLGVIVAVNVVTAVYILDKSGAETTREDSIQIFAEAYALDQSQSDVFLFKE
jgi:hypothetical protein